MRGAPWDGLYYAFVLEAVVGGSYYDPHSVLGAHPMGGQLVIRALRPDAAAVTVVIGEQRTEAQLIHPSGVWQAVLEGAEVRDYRLAVTYGIMQEHSGKIHVESEPGKGATFVMDLRASLKAVG